MKLINYNISTEQGIEWLEELCHENDGDFAPKWIETNRKRRGRYITACMKTIYNVHTKYRDYYDEDPYFWEKLPKPIFLYYRKTRQVRKELRNRPEYKVLNELCEATTSPVTSRRKDFLEKNKRTKKRRVLDPIYEGISNYRYVRLSDAAKKEMESSLCVTRCGSIHLRWFALRSWRWDETKIEPIYATWRGIPNSASISRHYELAKILYSRKSRYSKWTYKAMNWDSHRDKWGPLPWVVKDKEIKKIMIQELIEYETNKEDGVKT